jgi:cytochrome c2
LTGGFRFAYPTIDGALGAILGRTTFDAAVNPNGLPPGTMCVLDDDAKRGQAWARTRKGCHDIADGEPSHPSGGPNLQNVYMSVAGTSPVSLRQQHYPPLIAARDAGMIWTDDNLDEYLKGPEQLLTSRTGKHFNPAYYMNFFIGTEKLGGDRRDVIAYLKAIKGHPECD